MTATTDSELVQAARRVVSAWDSGSLADAVRELDDALASVDTTSRGPIVLRLTPEDLDTITEALGVLAANGPYLRDDGEHLAQLTRYVLRRQDEEAPIESAVDRAARTIAERTMAHLNVEATLADELLGDVPAHLRPDTDEIAEAAAGILRSILPTEPEEQT